MIRVLIFSVMLLTVSIASAEQPEAIPGEFLVKLRANAKSLGNLQIEKTLKAEIIDTVVPESGVILVRRPLVERPDVAIEQLSASDAIEYAEPNYVLKISKTPNDTEYQKLWGMSNTGQPDPKDPTNAAKNGTAGIDIGAEKAWDITTGSREVVVGIIDTGINYNHPDLKDNIWTNDAELNGKAGVDDDNNGYVDDVYGYDFANNKPNGLDDHGHGSHCAGTIGGKGDDGVGVVGVNWTVRMMPLKFLTSSGSGSLANAVKAIDYSVKMHANLTSNSWGGGGFSQTMKDAIDRAAKAGQLFIAAAGNDGADSDKSPMYPASYDVDNVISVAAINNKGILASFSNYGKTMVDLAAPGVSIYSSVLTGGGINKTGYDIYNGTSMATPHVSGVAALVWSAEPTLSYTDVKKRLLDTVQKIPGLKSKMVSGGLVNAYNALTNTIQPPSQEDPETWTQTELSVSTPHPYTANMSQSYEVKVEGAKQLAAYFEKFEVERDYGGVAYDKAEFFDKAGNLLETWTGSHSGEYSPTVTGDTLVIKLTTDDSYNLHGFDITRAGVKF